MSIPATPEGDKTPASPEAHALVIKIIDAFLANFSTTEEQMAQWVDDHVSPSRASLERRISALANEAERLRGILKFPPTGKDQDKGDGIARYEVVSRKTAFTYAAFCVGRTGRSVNVAEDSVPEFIAAAHELGLQAMQTTSHPPTPVNQPTPPPQ